ncbi:uncharacterized protein LOC127126141 [Lathyrus oleraceus]|uniref:Uncharacterized protein n=1 Tax=Pisum sativum TaxID=3888 RepID=A0A9D4XT85_PEA|nr:uncharacterized protein LOC127126141 [Pisum sativum]KAI5426659.1 hypothetical protein KIW84_032187 [Pisum sativum]
METLVIVAQHRNQYYGGSKSPRFGSSSASSHFRGINCRTFQTGSGILPTPFKSSTLASPDTKLKTPLSTPVSKSDRKGFCKDVHSSAPVPINDNGCRKEVAFVDANGSFLLSELWAGPTYSNSPPPSSLPIPKFSVRPKRTVSLELPISSLPEIEMRQFAYSAPCSPRQEDSPFAKDFFVNDDSATKTLCRILNLNLDDDE